MPQQSPPHEEGTKTPSPLAVFVLSATVGKRRSGTYNIAAKKNFRKRLRNSLTAAEAVLWKSLQGRRLLEKKFRRQVSIGRYIVDFYCPECRLVIELDGAAHFSMTIDEYDGQRTMYLEEEGLRVIRFENEEIFEDIDTVLEKIKESLAIKVPS
jgi:very-short-patch-repair endonuclease